MFIVCIYCGVLIQVVNFIVILTLLLNFYTSLLILITHIINVGDINMIISIDI